MSRRVDPPATLGQALSGALWMLMRRPHWLAVYALPTWVVGISLYPFVFAERNGPAVSSELAYFFIFFALGMAARPVRQSLRKLRAGQAPTLIASPITSLNHLLFITITSALLTGLFNLPLEMIAPSNLPSQGKVMAIGVVVLVAAMCSVCLHCPAEASIIKAFREEALPVLGSGPFGQIVLGVAFLGLLAVLSAVLILVSQIVLLELAKIDPLTTLLMPKIAYGSFVFVASMLHPVMYAHLYELLYTRRYGAGIEGLEEEF